MKQRTFQTVETNGIKLRTVVEGRGPLVIMVHGWPELWCSWRHQIDPVVAAGYRVAVPDVRGYGGSDRPHPVEAYTLKELTADIVGLIDALGEETATLVGHDWGAPIVWTTAVLHPARVSAAVGLSVPYLGRLPAPPMDLWKKVYEGRFFYQLYFQEEGVAEAEFEADARDTLKKIYFMASGDAPRDGLLANKKPEQKMLEGLPEVGELPWLPREELDYYVEAFEKTGFRGSLNRYRAQNRDWHELPELAELKVTQPALFIAGTEDPVLRFVPGMDLMEAMKRYYGDLRGQVLIEGAGHWVQQERPTEVNEALLGFLRSVAPSR